MRKTLYSILAISMAVTSGFAIAKRKYLLMDTKREAEISVEQERIRMMLMAKNAYGLGCMQSFERVCSLLKKDEAKRCIGYSSSYCSDASSNYTLKLKSILHGSN